MELTKTASTTRHGRAAAAGAGGAVAGLALLALTAALTPGTLFAQTPPAATPTVATHEQMHRMMDAMHGEGASDRMHEAMGPDGERLMDQCVAMMGMMQDMGSMMGGAGGMMGGSGMGEMMGGMMGRRATPTPGSR